MNLGRRLGDSSSSPYALPSPPSGRGWRRYQEVVTARPGPGRYTIYLKSDPLGLGMRGMGSLGVSAPQIVGSTAPIAAAGAGAAATAAGLGSFAGPIGAGVGALIGIIAGLWAAHNARVSGATTENQALSSAVAAWDQSMRAIFQAANAGQVTAAQASAQVTSVYQNFWASMCPYTKGPGRADTSNCGANCGSGQPNPAGWCAGTEGGHKCDKSCTATCCVGCQDIYPSMLWAQQVLASPTGGTVQVCNVAGASYGYSGRSSYSLTYTPPPAGSVAGVANSLSNVLSGATPGGSTSSTTDLLLLAAAAISLVLLV